MSHLAGKRVAILASNGFEEPELLEPLRGRGAHRDLLNAGARWIDRGVVIDQGLATPRTPKDLPAFCARLVEEIGEGRRSGQEASA
jgi:putative intracellular protease/amidase